jgi:hypothetical protein
VQNSPNGANTPELLSATKQEGPQAPIKSISIKALANQSGGNALSKQHQSNGQSEEEGIDPTWNNAFSQEQLNKAWLSYATSRQAKNPYLHTILSNQLPKAIGHELVLGLKNPMQEAEVVKEKASMFTYLKKQVKNASLTLTIQIVDETETKSKAYTSTDKFKAMMEQNPALAELKRLLDLDLE